MDHLKTGHFRPFEYRTTLVSGIQMNPEFGCPVFRWLLYFSTKHVTTGNTLTLEHQTSPIFDPTVLKFKTFLFIFVPLLLLLVLRFLLNSILAHLEPVRSIPKEN